MTCFRSCSRSPPGSAAAQSSGRGELPDVLVQQGTLLAELRHRLGYSIIRLPPLAERRDDIPALALRFLARCPEETGDPGPTRFAPAVLAFLQAAEWPGNARQLAMVVRDAYLRARHRDVVCLADLSDLVHLSVRFSRGGIRLPMPERCRSRSM